MIIMGNPSKRSGPSNRRSNDLCGIYCQISLKLRENVLHLVDLLEKIGEGKLLH